MQARVLAAAIATEALTLDGGAGLAGAAAANIAAVSTMAVNDAECEFVRWPAQYDERAMIRSAVWSTLLSEDVTMGVRRFFETGWEYAESRSSGSRPSYQDFVSHLVAMCVPAYSPEVFAVVPQASRTPDVKREAFVRTAYATARERDRCYRETA
ncbi:hypothetical protein OHA21_33280 [Actinoplanes sp. NBC_00393]|uniref:hypothetical protein n=1 Tax=Actinoplanes sp. NBC_00393 TaxID=2975953 RepID=UPI002E20AA93